MSEFVDEMFWTKRPDCSIIRLTRRQLVSKPSVQTGNPNFLQKKKNQYNLHNKYKLICCTKAPADVSEQKC